MYAVARSENLDTVMVSLHLTKEGAEVNKKRWQRMDEEGYQYEVIEPKLHK